MKVLYFLLLLAGFSFIVGCQNNQENTMVLLDEKIKEINISKSGGIGDMNQDILFPSMRNNQLNCLKKR